MSDVIPFPRRTIPQANAATSADDPNERLRIALTRLEEALARQRAAISTWQSALGDLKTSVTGLGSKFGHLNQSLDTLQGNITALHSTSLELEARADRMIEVNDNPASA